MGKSVTQKTVAGPIIANERLWLTADGEKVVPEGHPDAAQLLAAAGHAISHADAKRLGLVKVKKEEAKEEPPQVEAPKPKRRSKK